MNRINTIENEEIKNSEVSESHFDDEWHKEKMDKIREEKAEQKEHDLAQVSELTDVLFKNEKMPINDFIDNLRKDWLNEEEITKKLIIQWYSWDELMNSSIDDKVKSMLKQLKEEAVNNFEYYSYRFKNKDDLSDKYFDILKDMITNGIGFSDAVKSTPLIRSITMEDFDHLKEKHKDNTDYIPSIDLSGEILPDLDWSNSRDVFKYLAFDDKTFSRTTKEHLPEWFRPKEVFEKGKSIGLWIDDVHKMWYTWKWVSVAICDWQLKPHRDIQTKEYIVEQHAKKFNDFFHSSAVSSILAGKQTGVAPEADLYFFAEKQNDREEYWWNDLKSAFSKILEKNRQLPDNEKIKVISISGWLYGEWIKDLAMKLENSWVRVINSGDFFSDFWYLEKKDSMWDANNFQNYQHRIGWLDALYVNSGDRTVADPENIWAYRHDTHASASRAIPVVAWYYTLACQADPTMTPERFKKLARETAHEIDSTINIRKDNKQIRSTETRKIKVIDIKALIQKIEEEKK